MGLKWTNKGGLHLLEVQEKKVACLEKQHDVNHKNVEYRPAYIRNTKKSEFCSISKYKNFLQLQKLIKE